MSNPQFRVALIVFNNVELLDFAGPLEILSVAALPPFSCTHPPSPSGPEPARMPFTVSLLCETPSFTTSNGRGSTMLRDTDLFSPAGAPHNYDLALVPGGRGSRTEMHNPRLLGWLQQFARAGGSGGRRRVLMSVCTGGLVLAAAGLLDGLRAATHHHVRGLLAEVVAEKGGRVVVVEERVVWQALEGGAEVVTCGGVSSGIDAALEVVRELVGGECAVGTAQWAEYEWKDSCKSELGT